MITQNWDAAKWAVLLPATQACRWPLFATDGCVRRLRGGAKLDSPGEMCYGAENGI
jgi:hypothetical protein